MNEPTLNCQTEQRRHAVRQRGKNGLDYVEVSDDQRSLCVHFLGAIPEQLVKENIQITGGQRIRHIQVIGLEVERRDDPTLDGCLRVIVDRPGDFSTYTLRLVALNEQGQPSDRPYPNFDPRYAQVTFSFKVGCPSELDCQSQPICPPEERPEPDINYLAKDYTSFRQLILDRLALLMPDWQERHVPDLGVTLVELLAYVGDYLSYYQDAVATEAYLNTARQRISVRRHVRLVDYSMHEGSNSRTWVWLETSVDGELPTDVYLITRYKNAPPAPGTILTPDDLSNIPAPEYEVFEPMTRSPIPLYVAHNQISFYTWGNTECCLPQGATTATLLDEWVAPAATEPTEPKDPCEPPPETPPSPQLDRKLHLKVGDILIFVEVKGATTGNPGDADTNHRHGVRLTRVDAGVDELYPQQIENVGEMPTPIVEIEWKTEDALPFPLCISAIGRAPMCERIEEISVARGNVILVDHGRTVAPEDLGTVREKQAIAECEGIEQPGQVTVMAQRFSPQLQQTPLTFSQPLSPSELSQAPASRLLQQNPRQALPQILDLTSTLGESENSGSSDHLHWTPQPDLLASYPNNLHFVVEMDNERRAHLRFGDDELGRMPEVGMQFQAIYRIGNGVAGNVGAQTLSHVVFRQTRVSGWTLQPHNPLPAVGGTPPEPLSEVKLFAPHAFRQRLQRAITAEDYAQIVIRDFPMRVQRAAAKRRWTGSWYEVLVVVDPLGEREADAALLAEIAAHLYRYRRIGHDLVVEGARYVPLDIAMIICVHPDYLRGQVKAELLDRFSNRLLPNGQRGVFHPDNLTFGEGIALSQLVAVAQGVPGVENVNVTKLERLHEGNQGELARGILTLSPLEIARLDNNPNFPEHGKLTLDMRGGR